jgi:hypothetical protein
MDNSVWKVKVFSIVFLLIGCYFVIIGILRAINHRKHLGWKVTEAEIIDVELIPLKELLRSQSLGGKAITLLGLITTIAESFQYGTKSVPYMIVQFQYQFFGTTYTTKEALRHSVELKIGDIEKCRVNPANPKEASISTSAGFSILFFVIGITLSVIVIFMLILFWQQ